MQETTSAKKMEEEKTGKSGKEEDAGFKGIFSGFAKGFLGNWIGSRVYEIKENIKKAARSAVKKTVAAALAFLGFVFLLVGISRIIGEALDGNSGLGYVIVGVAVVLAGGVIASTSNK